MELLQPCCNSWSPQPLVYSTYCVHYVTYKVMELSPSLEAVSCSATHEISNILGNLIIHYYMHKILSQINLVLNLPSHLWRTLILFSHLCLGLPSSLSDGFSYKCMQGSPIHAICFAHLIFNFVIPVIYGETKNFILHNACAYINLNDMYLPLL